MIKRYSMEPMRLLWDEKNKYDIWLKVELSVCEARKVLGLLDDNTFSLIKKRATYSIDRINELEKLLKHDVLSFTTSVGENLGEYSRYFHQGLTSSDILDTSLGILLKKSSIILIKDIIQVIDKLKELAFKHKNTIMIGRTHGVHAEPITLGLKFSLWYSEMRRNLKRMKMTKEEVIYGKISGAVGTFAHIEPEVEEIVCKKLGLRPAKISSQILQRDRYAHFVCVLAIIASSVEKFATEIRSLQRTEILELEEIFLTNQKGSSAMPHKKNPVICERICGLSRILRGYALSALENNNLWNERDISNSSVERIILPDSTMLLDYILQKFLFVLDNLKINDINMQKNLDLTGGLIFSQIIMIKLTQKGLPREKAYEIVQGLALESWDNKESFKEKLLENNLINQYLTKDEIKSCFDVKYFTRNIDFIYHRLYEK
ncbi:MAG: adenylosuccinate lyase [Atribacterota bacterium]|nr:adenylosuccinate lyase [Atribacterota bacterium]MDD4895982.1 adenylosuccinate lyase [Atribacterota bacterium]